MSPRYLPRRLRRPRGPQYVIRYTGSEPLSPAAAATVRDMWRRSPRSIVTDARFDVRRLR